MGGWWALESFAGALLRLNGVFLVALALFGGDVDAKHAF